MWVDRCITWFVSTQLRYIYTQVPEKSILNAIFGNSLFPFAVEGAFSFHIYNQTNFSTFGVVAQSPIITVKYAFLFPGQDHFLVNNNRWMSPLSSEHRVKVRLSVPGELTA